MLMEGQFKVQAPILKVWEYMEDPKIIGSCLPGTEKMEITGENTYEFVMKQKVGPIKVKLKSTAKLTERRPPNYCKVVGKGADITKLGTFTFEMDFNLTEHKPNNVEVSYKVNYSMVGRLATFGERVMRAKANELNEQFAQNLQEKLKG
jgi:carbon monoxide dehydrogenase subunit G